MWRERDNGLLSLAWAAMLAGAFTFARASYGGGLQGGAARRCCS